MSGITNTGVIGYVSNPVAIFSKNSITVDIFGNTFYRGYVFGAGDDTGVYWNENVDYSERVLLFIAGTIQKRLAGLYSYGHKLRASQSFEIEIKLPMKDGGIDFDFIEKFVAELEAAHLAELEAYLQATGLTDYTLTPPEVEALSKFEQWQWRKRNVTEIFTVRNTRNILARDVVKDSGVIPYLGAGAADNSVISYIEFDESLLEEGNCIFIGGKTFVVTYQPNDFYSNDSHNLALYVNGFTANRNNQLFFATCLRTSLQYQYSWGNSISNAKINSDLMSIPINLQTSNDETEIIDPLITAVMKLVIKDVVEYAASRLKATREAIG